MWGRMAPPAATFPSWFTASSQRNAPKHPPKNPPRPPVLWCNALPTRFDHRYRLGGRGGGGIPEGRVAGAAPGHPQAAAARSLQRGGGQERRPGGRWPQGSSPQRGGRAAAEAKGGGGGGSGPQAALLPAAAGDGGRIFLQRLLGGLVRSRLLARSKRSPPRPSAAAGRERAGGEGERGPGGWVSHLDGRSQGGHLRCWQRSLLYQPDGCFLRCFVPVSL